MKMTNYKKETISYFEPDRRDGVTGEPPCVVSGIVYLVHGIESFDKRYQLESPPSPYNETVVVAVVEQTIKDGFDNGRIIAERLNAAKFQQRREKHG